MHIGALKIKSVTYGGTALRSPIELVATATPVDGRPNSITIQEAFVIAHFEKGVKRLIPMASVISLDAEDPAPKAGG